ncbi:MAG: menaquinone biosynthesis protein [Chitinophagaceae bacterium]|nr:menaquinone biosynthesis protein [Chitinophagaceae bacterium]
MRAKINQLAKIKVGIVNYLNTKPFLYGLENSEVYEEIDLVPDYPANVAAMLLENKIDVGLVPVAILPRLEESYIITDYCIGCDGEVASVCLFSDVPLDEVETILFDYQSRTSANLLKILLERFWKKETRYVDTRDDYRSRISGTTAGLVIGDRCLAFRPQAKYIYDLGDAWKQFTGLPFVFATWISNKKLPVDFIARFNAASKLGIDNIDEVAKLNRIDYYDSDHYFKKNIQYKLDEYKMEGMKLFLNYLETIK